MPNTEEIIKQLALALKAKKSCKYLLLKLPSYLIAPGSWNLDEDGELDSIETAIVIAELVTDLHREYPKWVDDIGLIYSEYLNNGNEEEQISAIMFYEDDLILANWPFLKIDRKDICFKIATRPVDSTSLFHINWKLNQSLRVVEVYPEMLEAVIKEIETSSDEFALGCKRLQVNLAGQLSSLVDIFTQLKLVTLKHSEFKTRARTVYQTLTHGLGLSEDHKIKLQIASFE